MSSNMHPHHAPTRSQAKSRDAMTYSPLKMLSIATNPSGSMFALYELAVAKKMSAVSGRPVSIDRDFELRHANSQLKSNLYSSPSAIVAIKFNKFFRFLRGLQTMALAPQCLQDTWLLSAGLIARNGSFKTKKISPKYTLAMLMTCLKLVEDLGYYAKISRYYDIALIDHQCYATGVAYIAFALRDKLIATNSYPHGLVVWRGLCGRSSSPWHINKLSNIKHCLRHDKAMTIQLKSLINKYHCGPSSALPYMVAVGESKTQPRRINSSELDGFKFIIYCHSFSDAQNYFGWDGSFNDVYEWLDFTISCLTQMNINFIVKAHPAFYAKKGTYESNIFDYDKEIYNSIYCKYCHFRQIMWINEPFPNHELLQLCNPNLTAMVSHHGTALIDAALAGFKCISSSAALLSGFGIFNEWRSKKQYKNLLSKDVGELAITNINQLVDCLKYHYCSESSYFHPNHFEEVLAKELGVSRKFLIHNNFRVSETINSLGDERRGKIASALSSHSVSLLDL